MRARRAAWICLAGALLALLVLLVGRAAETPVPVRKDAAVQDQGPAAGAATKATSRRAFPPLPPHDAPLDAIVPDLVTLADAGDRRAACRLGVELIRCSQLAEWERSVSVQIQDAESLLEAEGNLGAANHQAEEKIWRLQQLGRCAQLPDGLRSEGPRYLAEAARSGDPYAMLAYAEGQHFPLEGRGVFADPEFDAWRRDSAAMAHAALASGNPAAAFYLANAYGDDHGLFAAMVPDDPYRAYVYHLLMVRLFGHREQMHHVAVLGPGPAAEARREAAELHRRHFKGKRFEGSRAILPYLHSAPDPRRPQPPYCTD